MADDDKEVEINGTKINMRVPLEDWVKQIATEAGRESGKAFAEEFVRNCPIGKRVDKLNIKFVALVLFLTGLGILNVWNLFL